MSQYVPNLGFDLALGWRRFRLKEISKIYDGTHQTPKYKKSGIRFVSVEDIKNLYDSKKYISVEDFYRDFKHPPKKNDVLMTRIGDIGTCEIVTRDEPLAYYVSLALIKPSPRLDTNFCKALIESNGFKRELWKRTIHVAFPKKINKEEIGECQCHIPLFEIQKKIGALASLTDRRIKIQNKII